jgi:DNA repair exonuclease SbcCD nuclease subunit
MKRVFISDLHLHTWPYGGNVIDDGWNARLMRQWHTLQEVLLYVQKNNVKYLYCNGDIFHTPGNIPTQALHVAAWFFRMLDCCGCKYRVLVGNHDMANRSGNINGLSFLHEENLAFPDAGSRWEDDGLVVYGLGYTENEETIKSFLGNASTGSGGMVLLHQGVAGVPISSGFVIDERLTPEMIPDNCMAFTGHYHYHRVVATNLIVVGNLTPQSWSDIDQAKGWVVWDDETDQLEFIEQTTSPKFLSYEGGYSAVDIEGNFLRYVTEVSPREISSIRGELVDQGAKKVEFPNIKEKGGKIHQVAISFDYNKIVEAITDPEMEPRRVEVGAELREERYGAPAKA